MDPARLGRTFRALRLHLGLRQLDVAERAGVSQQHVSDMERGRIGDMTVHEVARLFTVLDARVSVVVSWRGGELDRLLDEDHAAAVGVVADILRADGWEVVPEATYSVYGERGSIDLLAWHPATRTLLVVEVKSEITSAEELLRRHDAKVRLWARIGRERFGVTPVAVGRLLAVVDTATNRRRVTRLNAVIGTTYPVRGSALRAWLAAPVGPVGGLLFADTARAGVRRGRRRVARTGRTRNTAAGGA